MMLKQLGGGVWQSLQSRIDPLLLVVLFFFHPNSSNPLYFNPAFVALYII